MKLGTVLKTTITLVILVSSLYSITFRVFAQPSPGCVFYGYVTIDGTPAPNYLNITAVIAGTTLSWETYTANGTYGWPLKGGANLFTIPSQNESDSQKDGGSEGDFILFYVNGTKAPQTSNFDASGAIKVDLSITTVRGQTTLTVSINCSTTYLQYEVNISGQLTDQNGNGVQGTNLLAAYSTTSGQSWNSIASFNTTVTGYYSLEWMPASTGSYTIRVSWGGNQNFNAVEALMNLTTLPLEGKNSAPAYVFSVISNSTILDLAYNSSSNVLGFTIEGPSGTTGYANITIAKKLVMDTNGMKVYVDGNQTEYTTIATDDSYLLHFTYQHSNHEVTVDLSQPPQPFFETLPGIATVAVIIAILLIAATYIGRNRLRRPQKTKPMKSSLKP